jgi:hypothetical protein
MNNMDLRRGRFGMQTKAQDERLCRSQQAACNAGMRPKRPRPGGLPCIRAAAALQSLRMEQPFAALCGLTSIPNTRQRKSMLFIYEPLICCSWNLGACEIREKWLFQD